MHKLSFLKLITRNLNPLHKPTNRYALPLQRAIISPLIKGPKLPFPNELFKPKTPSNVHPEFGFLRAQIKGYCSRSNQLVTRHNKRGSPFRWILTTNGVITCLFLSNTAVFPLWKVADREFMSRNFTLRLEKLKSGHYHTVITSAFSHITTVHFLGNMFVLCFFGWRIGQMFGSRFMLKLYLAGAFSGSFFVLAQQAFLAQPLKMLGRDIAHPNLYVATPLGATASVKAILMLDLFLRPSSALSITMMIFIFGYDVLVLCEEIVVNDGEVEGFSFLGADVVALIVWACLTRRPNIYY